MKSIPLQLLEYGFRPLVSVIPPDAPLSPGSTIPLSQRGKCPGRKLGNGTWAGYGWLTHVATTEDVKQWAHDGANIGILAEHYPAVDIDTLSPWLSAEIAGIARRVLGAAPSRVGKAPKQLLMYRTGTPFPRMAVVIHMRGVDHLVEVLGSKRQYLIYGQHPSGSRYTWDTDLLTINPETELAWIEQPDVERFLTELQDSLEMIPGVVVERVAAGRVRAGDVTQADLLAPSVQALRECVAAIPNTDELFPDRDDYIKVGYAIRAAAGEDDEDGFEIFLEWCGRWDGGTNDPEVARGDWRRMHPPYAVGWSWLAEIAARCGFNAAQHEFEADQVLALEEAREQVPEWSDAWLAERVIEEFGHMVRYVPAQSRWYVWDGGRWESDAVLRADFLVGRTLRRLASLLLQRGASDAERAANGKLAAKLCAAQRHRDVRHLMRIDSRITAPPEAFDADPWLLNTPSGLVDLRTGETREHDPAAMCSRQTLVAPDFEMAVPRWGRFLMEATGGDVELQEYLRRLMGYGLTGSTREEMFAFIHGPGGAGKGTFMGALINILADYHTSAPMDTFTATATHGHPTELAGLAGARLVTAVETDAGHRWDEQRIKTLTGRDPIRARFMRSDFFTYMPQFLLCLYGNHRPEIRNLDVAMQRRIHLVPFTHLPEVVDDSLKDDLRAEYPAILAWAIRGSLQWQERGLRPPPVVVAATREYFDDEDPVGRWMSERLVRDPGQWCSLQELFDSWQQWAGERREYVGTSKRLRDVLIGKQLPRQTRGERVGFIGLRTAEQALNELLPGG